MNNEKLIRKMMKEIDDVKKIRLDNFQKQISKDFSKIRKKYERLLKFKKVKKK